MAGAYETMNNGELMNLAEVPLNILYRRLSPGMLAPCVVRSCELLADSIHTHYLITQWHLTPFDEKNRQWRYLHRCPVDLKTSSSGGSPIQSYLFVPPTHRVMFALARRFPWTEPSSRLGGSNQRLRHNERLHRRRRRVLLPHIICLSNTLE